MALAGMPLPPDTTHADSDAPQADFGFSWGVRF